MIKELLLISLTCLVLASCVTQEHGTMQNTTYNNLPAIHQNVAEGLRDLHYGYTNLAEEKLTQAYEQNPYDPFVLDGLGYYYEKIGDPSKANQYFNAALLYQPNSAIALNNYGAFLCRNGSYQAASWYFRRALQLPKDPQNPNIQSNMQFCQVEQQRALGGSTIYAYDMAKNGFDLNSRMDY